MAREESIFDELARGLADGSVTRAKALKLMGAALVGGTLGSVGIGEAAAAPGGCKRNGKKCKKDTQCCSGNCVNKTCAACPSGTTPCGTECCQTGASCVDGTCCPDAQVCATGTTLTCCAEGEQCVEGVCGPACIPLGSGPCTDFAQCCGISVCDANGTCCASGNQRCTVDSECCGDFTCQESQCLPVCLENGFICSTSGPPPCCSGSCVNGTCACPSGTVELSNGTCARPCDPGADEPCPEFTCACVSDNSGGTYCFAAGGSQTSCPTDSQCPPGEFCAPTGPGGGNGVCVRAC